MSYKSKNLKPPKSKNRKKKGINLMSYRPPSPAQMQNAPDPSKTKLTREEANYERAVQDFNLSLSFRAQQLDTAKAILLAQTGGRHEPPQRLIDAATDYLVKELGVEYDLTPPAFPGSDAP